MAFSISGYTGMVQDCLDIGAIYHTQKNISSVTSVLIILRGIYADPAPCSKSIHTKQQMFCFGLFYFIYLLWVLANFATVS